MLFVATPDPAKLSQPTIFNNPVKQSCQQTNGVILGMKRPDCAKMSAVQLIVRQVLIIGCRGYLHMDIR